MIHATPKAANRNKPKAAQPFRSNHLEVATWDICAQVSKREKKVKKKNFLYFVFPTFFLLPTLAAPQSNLKERERAKWEIFSSYSFSFFMSQMQRILFLFFDLHALIAQLAPLPARRYSWETTTIRELASSLWAPFIYISLVQYLLQRANNIKFSLLAAANPMPKSLRPTTTTTTRWRDDNSRRF